MLKAVVLVDTSDTLSTELVLLTFVSLHCPHCKANMFSFQSIYHWVLLQGSVSEDKASSSHVVVPIPTSLEEGEVSISFKHDTLYFMSAALSCIQRFY